MLADVEAVVYTGATAKPISPRVVQFLFFLTDLLVIIIMGAAVYGAYLAPVQSIFGGRYGASILVGGGVAVSVLYLMNAYSIDWIYSQKIAIGRVCAAWALTFALLLTVAFALKISSNYSRVWATGWFVSAGIGLVVVRLVMSAWVQKLAQLGHFARRTAIFGAGQEGQALANHLLKSSDAFTRLVGFFDDRHTRVPQDVKGLKLLGDIDHAIAAIRGDAVDQVFVALPLNASARISEIVQKLSVTTVPICLVPEVGSFNYPNSRLTRVSGIQLWQILDRPISGWSHALKFAEDKVLSSLLLLFFGPLFLLIAICIKLDSPGPVFFRQPRYGLNNNIINVWKFRTMYAHAADEHCQTQTARDDDRVTRVGRFLRRSSLDELPQFFNVLLGNMSLVGPRPHALATKAEGRLFADIVERYAARHRVKPGITGWAQVHGWRGETDTIDKIQKRVEFDLYYIENWSIWLDIYILLKTVFIVLKGENAH